MKYTVLILPALLLAWASSAFAGPSDDAKAHFHAIAAGNVEQIMQGYGSTALLQWVGGPLDGSYQGMGDIKAVWSKFAKASGPLQLDISGLTESANPKGATVTANVAFKGKKQIKVRYVLTYRNGQLVNEVWQIDPKLALSAY